MKAVMLMFDTLTRNHLAPYGGDAITPNFTQLARESAQFDNFYVGSMPCMPARRELHTGRYNFPAPQLGATGAVRFLHVPGTESGRYSRPHGD